MSHELEFCLTFSMSAVTPGHKTLELALEVMLEMPPLLLPVESLKYFGPEAGWDHDPLLVHDHWGLGGQVGLHREEWHQLWRPLAAILWEAGLYQFQEPLKLSVLS